MPTNQDYWNLACSAFGRKLTGGKTRFTKLLERAHVHSHFEKNQLTSMVMDIPYQVNFQKQIVPLSGIAFVATYPEYRGNGAIRQLMTEILQKNYEKETILSYLDPFSYSFYRKFGYALAFNQKKYSLPATEFPKGFQGHVEELSFKEALPHLSYIFEQAPANGTPIRDEWLWTYNFQSRLQPHFALVFDEKNDAQAYVIYNQNKTNFEIIELISLDELSKQALYHFISSIIPEECNIIWTAPDTERFENDCVEPRHVQTEFYPFMQARIVNLKRYCELFGEPNFDVQITDPILPQNNLNFGQHPVKMTIGEFTSKILQKQHSILREIF
jgi:predicted acetyltransferase